MTGANAMGRWDYGPWFWPPYTGLQYGEAVNPYYDPLCDTSITYCEPPFIPGTPVISGVPEGFMDTPLVNGKAYFPAVFTYPETTFGGDFETAADYRDPYLQELIAKKGGTVIWPPMGYVPDPGSN